MEISDLWLAVLTVFLMQFALLGFCVAVAFVVAVVYLLRYNHKKVNLYAGNPRNLKICQFDECSIFLKWSPPLNTKPDSAIMYTIQKRESDSSKWVPVDVCSAITYTVQNLSPDQYYCFRVSCGNNGQPLESAPVQPAKSTDFPGIVDIYRRGPFIVFDWEKPSHWHAKSYDFEVSESGELWNPIASNVVDTKYIMDTEYGSCGFVDDILYWYRITPVGENARGIPKIGTWVISKLEDRQLDHLIQSTDSVSQCGSVKQEGIRCRNTPQSHFTRQQSLHTFGQPCTPEPIHDVSTHASIRKDDQQFPAINIYSPSHTEDVPKVPFHIEDVPKVTTMHYRFVSGKLTGTSHADAYDEETEISTSTNSTSFVSFPPNTSLRVVLDPGEDATSVKQLEGETTSPIVSFETDTSLSETPGPVNQRTLDDPTTAHRNNPTVILMKVHPNGYKELTFT
ncbi:hypothetical protein ScPMuIL_002478 [Solemya velum]